ncbi:Short-chain dehydrogenase/reductase SDR [Corchorus olitorius]|uniref:Short-chain dehydrogenase/reductase SDR n=1 Tax=Corchorus olitorius TaxID=93759 RepID=A0A1R3HDS3_9ROSI|nr:Short-chain dehydrogenase/reductase SDR [Corchorus olitorius]
MYNNAGIHGSTMKSIPDLTKSEIDQVIGVNLIGSMFGAKHAARVMMAQRKGCILFTASLSAVISGLLASNAYVVSKYGILGLTKNLAAELGPYGIRVNCVSPYAVATPMTVPDPSMASELEASWSAMSNLKGEILKPEGVANAALYLASDEANYVSGVNLVIDGGFSILNPTIFIEGKMSGASSLISPLKRLAGKVAILTGGASGIGATTATLFHKNGAKVIIADIQDTKGEALANKLGENACYIHCDVTKEDDIRNLTDAAIAKHGKLDIMYSNAGILDRPLCCIIDTPKSEIDQILGINLVGAMLGAKHAARVMVPNQKGCILFTASACTAIGGLLAGNSYVVSKYGVLGLTKNLAAELGQHGIRVNCISPYGVATPLIVPNEAEITSMEISLAAMGNLKGEILKPEGVAQAALYLASDEANYVSGLNLVVDGGFSIINPTIMKAYIQ